MALLTLDEIDESTEFNKARRPFQFPSITVYDIITGDVFTRESTKVMNFTGSRTF